MNVSIGVRPAPPGDNAMLRSGSTASISSASGDRTLTKILCRSFEGLAADTSRVGAPVDDVLEIGTNCAVHAPPKSIGSHTRSARDESLVGKYKNYLC